MGNWGYVREMQRSAKDIESQIIMEICSAARKVIGFTPIEPRMLELQMKCYGANDLEEAKLMEIKSYLKCELKVPPSVINSLDIIKIFPPAKDHWNVLYVEFASELEVNNLFKYNKNMRHKDHRVVHWCPKQLFPRYKAVESIAYTLRQEEHLKTRVKVGIDDIELSTRNPDSKIWKRYQLEGNLPKINLNNQTTKSPPSGKTTRDQTENPDNHRTSSLQANPLTINLRPSYVFPCSSSKSISSGRI